MLDRRLLREDPDLIREALANRGIAFDLDWLIALDEERRSVIEEAQALREKRNALSQRAGEVIKAEVADRKPQLASAEDRKRELEAEFERRWVELPNIPKPEVPVGATAEDNLVVHERGERRTFAFEPQPHWDIATGLGIIEWDRAAKIAAARFVVDVGLGAALERALINFMLDTHTRRHGYTEVMPPILACERSMFGCGMLPKFEADMFKTAEGLYLVPTGEVPLTNMHQDEILEAADLPRCYTTYTPCFRAEAGAAGQESRGLIRLHQFHKVELMKFTTPDQADDELEKLTANAETILEVLGLPYRRVLLCTGDLGFSSCRTFDLEGWMPGMGKWVEISSCSQFGDFQARRANTRYRPEPKAKPAFGILGFIAKSILQAILAP